jgi:hypothetical protein
MAVNLSFIGGAGWQFFDDNGDPLSGGKIYTYAAGTSYPLTTYTSNAGNIPNTNPVILDAAGRTPQQIWSTEGVLYKYVVTSSTDVVIRTWDNIGGSIVASDLAQDLANTTNNAKGDALVGFKQSNASGFLTGAVAKTVNDKLQEILSVKDFGATGDGATDDRASIQDAINYAVSVGAALFFPQGTYRITAPLIVRLYAIRMFGARRGDAGRGTRIYLDSTTVGDYAIILSATGFTPFGMVITDIEFKGTNSVADQGGIKFAGRYSWTSLERLTFDTFTGYAIGRDPTVTSYTQNNALRDITFISVGGCYGLTSEPAAGAAYLGETLLTISNVNLEAGIITTSPKPYIWDFRASRQINASIMLVEGARAAVTAGLAFCTNSYSYIETFWCEFSVTEPTYTAIFLADPTNKFYSSTAAQVTINNIVSGATPIRFEQTEAVVTVNEWVSYNIASAADVASFAGPYGFLTVRNLYCKLQFTIPDNLYGRLLLNCISEDSANNKVSIPSGSSLLWRWNAAAGSLLTAAGAFFVPSIASGVASNAVEAYGTMLVHRFTSPVGAVPNLWWEFTLPSSFDDCIVTLVVRYRVDVDAVDASTVPNMLGVSTNPLTEITAVNGRFKNADATAVATGRFVSGTNYRLRTGYSGLAPTVPVITRIMAVEAYAGPAPSLTLAVARA